LHVEDENPYLDDPNIIYTVNADKVNNACLNPYDLNQMMILSKETNPQILDLTKNELFWKARNVKNDDYDLKVPINDIDCAFKNKNEIYVCTAYRKIRLYDVRVKNCKPVVDHKDEFDKYHFNNILIKGNDQNHELYVSDVSGGVYVLDPRKNFRVVGKFKGANGSIRKMSASRSSPYFLSVSLDRFARIYNTNNMKLYQKIFLKQKLNCCAIIDEKFDTKAMEKKLQEVPAIKKWEHQNEIKKKAVEMRQKMKENRMLLTF